MVSAYIVLDTFLVSGGKIMDKNEKGSGILEIVGGALNLAGGALIMAAGIVKLANKNK
jgi:hypothetical protein